MVKRVASGLLKALITLAVALLVVVAVMVGMARQFMADIQNLRPDITAFLSRQSGLSLEMDTISGSWK